MTATTIPETKSPNLVTLDPTTVARWSFDLGRVINDLNRIDRRHADAVNEIRGHMGVVATFSAPVSMFTIEPLTWMTTVLLVAYKIGPGDAQSVLRRVADAIGEIVGVEVAK